MMPDALDLISTLVVGSIFPVATTERARSMRSTFTSFSGSILVGVRLNARTEKNAAPPTTGRRARRIQARERFLGVAISSSHYLYPRRRGRWVCSVVGVGFSLPIRFEARTVLPPPRHPHPAGEVCFNQALAPFMSFIHEDFLLHTKTARRFYHQFAEDQPILDYHCHLPPQDVAENRRFQNLFEIWLEGDHYKWRAIRANGVPESLCTGDAPVYEKYLAWERTVPYTLRNPLYHWTHLELQRYFGITELLDEGSAPRVWEQANALLGTDELSAHGILGKFRVKAVCTTDDPTDDLAWHRAIAASPLGTKVFPTFRPDKALNVHVPELLNAWVDRLAAVSNTEISTLADFVDALRKRHDFFHQMGGRLSDHGLNHAFGSFPSEHEAATIFGRARGGHAATHEEHIRFASYMMLIFGRLDAEKGWTKQLHLGARRNNNTRRFHEMGADTGWDSIGDWPQADAMGAYLDRLDQENAIH